MSTMTATPSFQPTPPGSPAARLETLFDELAELCGQRNVIDGRIVDIVAEIDHDGIWGHTGARSVAALVAWKTGTSPANAANIAAIAHRAENFPRCTQGLRDGRVSLDQLAVIAQHAADGSDDHYAGLDTEFAGLAEIATVTQLRTAVRLEPRPEPNPRDPWRGPEIRQHHDGDYDTWRIRLAKTEAAMFDAALATHLDTLITEWTHTHDTDDNPGAGLPADDNAAKSDSDCAENPGRPPKPTMLDAFLHLVESGWDAEATRRPHAQRSTVVIHLDIAEQIANLHLGPLLTDADRRYLTCDATCEIWYERNGQPIGAGRTTRTISRRLRRALEHRDHCCVVPGCHATRGLHAHHIIHWENGGETELDNLVLICPYHHRLHHQGLLNITGPATQLAITDETGHRLTDRSLARPPTTAPPQANPYPGPIGEHAQWRWYQPFEPKPPPGN